MIVKTASYIKKVVTLIFSSLEKGNGCPAPRRKPGARSAEVETGSAQDRATIEESST
jgi:hypothetical protein